MTAYNAVPPELRRPPSVPGRNGAQRSSAVTSARSNATEESGPPLGVLALLAVAAVTSLSLVPYSVAHSRATAIGPLTIVGWVLGALVGLGCFAWYRSVDRSRSGGRYYASPRWRPALVARVLAVAAWLIGVVHAWAVAEALARR
jgi:hypothetical protein